MFDVIPQSLINDCAGAASVVLDNGEVQIPIEGICDPKDFGFEEERLQAYWLEDDFLQIEIWLE